jgi:hypothetical protein
MPRFTSETFGSGDMRWLASDHGMFNAETGTLDVSTFTKANAYPDMYFRSGTKVNCSDMGAVKPWTGAVSELLGFVLRDQPTNGVADEPTAIIAHGLIKTAFLPVDGATLPASAPSGFVFIGGN